MRISIDQVLLALLAAPLLGCPASPGRVAGPQCIDPPADEVRAGTAGAQLFLESRGGLDLARVALDASRGGLLSSATLDGAEHLQAVAVSLWSNATAENIAAQLDDDGNGAPVVGQRLGPDGLYLMVRMLKGSPRRYGGGPGAPVPADAYLEVWLAPVPGHMRAFQLHHRVTYVGSEEAYARQGAPDVFVAPGFDRLAYYGGGNPWTQGVLTSVSPLAGGNLRTLERWIAYLDAKGSGLTVFTPGHFPYWSVSDHGRGFLDANPLAPFSWEAGATLDADTFLFLGPLCAARDTIYQIHAEAAGAGPFPPLGSLDQPDAGAVLTGVVPVSGWAVVSDPVADPMAAVKVSVDGSLAGLASYGLLRGDIALTWPDAPPDVGWGYQLDTTAFANGGHSVRVTARTSQGRAAILDTRQVTFGN